jgi:DNA-binding NarL/FixJ family response regulator
MAPAPHLATIADRPGGHHTAARRHLRLVPRTLRVVIADDLELHRAGLRALLEGADDIVVVGEARRGGEAPALAREVRPDVVVLDLGVRPLQALQTAWEIVTDPELSDVGVLILTPPDPGTGAPSGRRCGACRFLVKDSAATDLLAAVRALAFRPGHRAADEPPCVRRAHRNQKAPSWNSAI